jgi:hypothetical protein
MNKHLESVVVTLVDRGHLDAKRGTEADNDLRDLVIYGFARKAWFRRRYFPTREAKELRALKKIDSLFMKAFTVELAEFRNEYLLAKESK